MKYVIKSETTNEFYQGTILRENHFTPNTEEAVKFKSEKMAKDTIKWNTIPNAIIIQTNN